MLIASMVIKKYFRRWHTELDLVGLNDRGGVEIHDVQAQSLLWSGGTSGTSAALVLNDLDNDGEREILVALQDHIIVYGRNSTGTAYLERAS